MKVLVCSTPATGHINPMLAISKILIDDGHDVVFLTGSSFQGRIEAAGANFRALGGRANLDINDVFALAPELKTTEPGLDWLRIAIERIFMAMIPDQVVSLQSALQDHAADIIIGDDMFFGLIPTLMRPRAERPPVVLCGTSFLHWTRDDKAPHFLGLPPASTDADFQRYAAIASDYEERVNRPVREQLNAILGSMKLPLVKLPLFEAVVALADHYLQLTVPRFEFVSSYPPSVQFIGALPIIKGQAPIPSWSNDLDGSRRVVLVTQGTVANFNFDLLVGPTLAALANEPDVLVIVTAGGRPIDSVPGPIPSNARVADYLPFEWLLPKVDVLVTNGGYGSVNQALSHGIPIVAAGLTEDKADVAVRIGWSGAGINMCTNNPDEHSIRSAVRALLDKPAYRKRAEDLASEYATYDARKAVTQLARATVRPVQLRRAG